MIDHPFGPILLFGSGETQPASGKAYERLNRLIGAPPCISILETPAGFQPNSDKVAGEVGDFLKKRLQNYQPRVEIIPARCKTQPFSTNDANLLEPMLRSNWIFMGPGSPTYAIRQLRDSLAYAYLRALHMNGSAICLASAAVLAVSRHTLPVYEIYKVGEDPFWTRGLVFLAVFNLHITFIPHWNNQDGGAGLDTSRCFMGRLRFERMLADLPTGSTLVGIDEQTSLLINFDTNPHFEVFGIGTVTICKDGKEESFSSSEKFSVEVLGKYHPPKENADVSIKIPAETMGKFKTGHAAQASQPSEQVYALMHRREEARSRKDWRKADKLRAQLLAEGWLVTDTPDGPVLTRGR